MGNVEIERKFLVRSEAWRGRSKGILFRQGFLAADPQRTVRVRIAGDRAFLTVKGAQQGMSRQEFEYEIPVLEAEQMLGLCSWCLIEKRRYSVPCQGMFWEVDEFRGENAGLVVAEIELESESQEFARPEWLGEEVTQDPRYLNANLAKHPYSQWGVAASYDPERGEKAEE